MSRVWTVLVPHLSWIMPGSTWLYYLGCSAVSTMQDEVSTAIASFTRMWQDGELENSDSVAQGMLGSFLSTDLNLDTMAGTCFALMACDT